MSLVNTEETDHDRWRYRTDYQQWTFRPLLYLLLPAFPVSTCLYLPLPIYSCLILQISWSFSWICAIFLNLGDFIEFWLLLEFGDFLEFGWFHWILVIFLNFGDFLEFWWFCLILVNFGDFLEFWWFCCIWWILVILVNFGEFWWF